MLLTVYFFEIVKYSWSATFARLGPQTAITFLVYEKLRQLIGIRAL